MMKIKKLAKLLGLCCLTAGLALPSAAQAATGDDGHVTATSVLAEKAGQKPAVTETKAAQQIEAAAKAEEEARAKAEELGIGAVDLTEIDTEPMSAALDVLLAAQRAYFAEEASAQAAYAAQAAQSA